MAVDDAGSGGFETGTFLKFLFSVVFLFVCCLTLMLYLSRSAGLFVTFVMRYLVLPKQTVFYIGGFHLSPLQARVFFQDVYFQDENISLRIVDGYYTFAFWGGWISHPNWTHVHEYMVSDSLIGMRCRVPINLKYVKGTIVGVETEKRKLLVQLDFGPSAGSLDNDNSDEEAVATSRNSADAEQEPAPTNILLDGSMLNNFYSFEGKTGTSTMTMGDSNAMNNATTSGTGAKGKTDGTGIGGDNANAATMTAAVNIGEGDEVIKAFDVKDVHIRNRPGRSQVHLNGMRFCLFNATGKYNDLTVDPETAARKLREERERQASGSVPTTQKLFHKYKQKKAAAAAAAASHVHLDDAEAHAGNRVENNAVSAAEREDEKLDGARKMQKHNLHNKSLTQRFFAFVEAVELEFFSSTIDIGGAGSNHPYFLHISFHRGEGRIFLTRDGCQKVDLYRTVTELTLQRVDMRMAQMNSKLTENQVMRNPSLRDRAELMFGSTARKVVGQEKSYIADHLSSDLIRDFGILMDGQDNGNIHLVIYKDTPNVYAGEEVARKTVPKTGVEVLLDSPKICYGPWLEYCRSQLFLFFLPPNYRPLAALEFVIGEPRPNGGIEFFVEFMRETRVVIPFKRRAITPSPPFGIEDSHKKGLISGTIGAGSQLIQPGVFLMPNEIKQNYEALFISRDVTVMANAILDCDTIFVKAEAIQLFIDRQDDILWNGRKLWNFMPKITGGELFFAMSYVDFFLDLINDWQFSANTYHNVPLTTEMYNTYERCVRDCIPNVKRMEVFLDGGFTFNISANDKNVIFSEDPNDMSQNIFATLKLQSASFNVVLPGDQYQLSYENEIVRPLSVSGKDIRVYLSLPRTHPLYGLVPQDVPWATSDGAEVNGRFCSLVPNQAVPQPRDNLMEVTGRTRYRNYFDLDIEFVNVRGELMAPHILALINVFHNIFLDHIMVIRPDELFWLLAKLQSHATTNQNKRSEFKHYQERGEPAGNDLELCVTVRLVNISATATIGPQPGYPGVNLSTGLLSFTYVKQFAVTDTAITLSPVTLRFLNPITASADIGAESSYICIGDISVGMIKHFGCMPLKPKVHDSIDVNCAGVSFDVTTERLMELAQTVIGLLEQLRMDDAAMVAVVQEARTVAELAAEQIIKGPARRAEMELRSRQIREYQQQRQSLTQQLQQEDGLHSRIPASMSDSGASGGKPREDAEAEAPAGAGTPSVVEGRDSAEPVAALSASYDAYDATNSNVKPRRRRNVFFRLGGNSDDDDSDDDNKDSVPKTNGFADEVPYDVAVGFAEFMEACRKAEDDSKDYGLFFTFIAVGPISGSVKIRDEGVVMLELPSGVSLADSTLNDGNSNKRTSIAVRNLAVRALVPKTRKSTAFVPIGLSTPLSASGDYLEVFSIQTSLCMRHYTAYPFDGSLESHFHKQRKFAIENDYEDLIGFNFHSGSTTAVYDDDESDSALGGPLAGDGQMGSPDGFSSVTTATRDAPRTQPRANRVSSPAAAHSTLEYVGVPAALNGPFHEREGHRVVASAPSSLDDSLRIRTTMDLLGGDVALGNSRHSATGSEQNGFVPLKDSMMPTALHERGTVRGMSDRSTDDVVSSGSDPADLHKADQSSGGGAYSYGAQDTLGTVNGGEASGSNNFATCLSASDFSDFVEGSSFSYPSETDNLNGDASFGGFTSQPPPKADASEKTGSLGDVQQQGQVKGVGERKMTDSLRPETPSTRSQGNGRGGMAPTSAGASASTMPKVSEALQLHRFYRVFFKAQRGSEGVTQLDYIPLSRIDASGMSSPSFFPKHVHFGAPLPAPGFMLYTAPDEAPENALLREMSSSDGEENGDTAASLFEWAMRPADNRERSRTGTTSKHIHAEMIDPMRILVTKEAALLAAAALTVFSDVTVKAAADAAKREEKEKQKEENLQSEVVDDNECTTGSMSSPTRTAAGFRAEQSTKKSRVRTQQKRWLWEDRIVSAIVPSVELRVLTGLPVPDENQYPRGSGGMGTYCSHLCVRGLQFVMSENTPPTGVEAPTQESKKLCASLRVSTLALLTQIEYEPLPREGNMNVKVPNLLYQESKDTIAVAYMAAVQGRGKRDTVRGTDGGVCIVRIDTVEVHLVRDFFDYLSSLHSLVMDVKYSIQAKLSTLDFLSAFKSGGAAAAGDRGGSGSFAVITPSPSMQLLQRQSSNVLSAGGRTSSYAFGRGGAGAASGTFSGFDRGRTVQGKGLLRHFKLALLNSRREGRRVVVDPPKAATMLELLSTSANFFVMTPQRSRDRSMQLQFIGEMDVMRLKLFPSLLHTIRTRSSQPMLSRASTEQLSRQGSTVFIVTESASVNPQTSGTAKGDADERAATHRLNLIYNGTFTMRTLDVSMMHSEMNYAQLKGKGLTGCAESRSEPVSSRECVQMEVLTEAISDRLKARLLFLAHRARERAKRSRYTSPACTTGQLQLKSTASFFAEQLLCHYIADAVITSPSGGSGGRANRNVDSQSKGGGGGGADTIRQRKRESQVLVAVIDDIAVAAQFTTQHDINGEQANVEVMVNKILIKSPYRPQAVETIHPQAHQFMDAWRKAIKTVSGSVKRRSDTQWRRPPSQSSGSPLVRQDASTLLGVSGGADGAPTSSSTLSGVSGGADGAPTSSFILDAPMLERNRALVLSVQACNIETTICLPQNIQQKFLLPKLSVFVQHSSNGRLSLKVHAHPFTITCKSPFPETYHVTLPDMYILYAQDTIKQTGSIMIETVAITVTPLFVNHLLCSYKKVSSEIVAVLSKHAPLDVSGYEDGDALSPSSMTAGHTEKLSTFDSSPLTLPQSYLADNGSFNSVKAIPAASAKLNKRRGFLLLLKGLRFSYLTSMTNLRFSIKRLNATADTSEAGSRKTLDWVVNVMSAQVALVDRDDHDQMTATVNNMRQSSIIASQVRRDTMMHTVKTTTAEHSTSIHSYTPGAARTAVAAEKDDTQHCCHHELATQVRSSHPLSGFIWGSAELSLTISSGKTARNEAEGSLTNTSFNAYSPELQKALLDKLGHSSSQWKLKIHTPLVILRVGLDELLKQCIKETQHDIGHMKSMALEERKRFEKHLRQHKSFQKMKREQKSYEATVKRAEKEQKDQLRRMTEQVAYDVSQRRGGITLNSSAMDTLASCFNVIIEHMVTATVTDFLIVLPFGDAAYRSLLEDLPGAYSCGKVERHIHTQNCLNRRHFIPTLAIKAKVDDISLLCNYKSVHSLLANNDVRTPAVPRRGITAISQGPFIPSAGNTSSAKESNWYTKLCGKLVASNMNAFFTDGSPISPDLDVVELVDLTCILGGLGSLTSYSSEERRRSRNNVYVKALECPFLIQQEMEHTNVSVVVDLSGPLVQLSSRAVSIISELSKEMSDASLDGQLHPHRAANNHRAAHVDPATNVDRAGTPAQSGVKKKLQQQDGTDRNYGETTTSRSPSLPWPTLRVDVNGRLEAGRVRVYSSAQPGEAANDGGSIRRASDSTRKFGPKRTVGFSTGGGAAGGSTTSPRSMNAPSSFALHENSLTCILEFPLPSVTLGLMSTSSGDPTGEDVTAVRVEVVAGVIQLSPSITALAREIEQCANIYNGSQMEGRRRILLVVQDMERDAAALNLPLHCALVDVLLPMPRAYAAALSRERMRNAIHIHRGPTPMSSGLAKSRTEQRRGVPDAAHGQGYDDDGSSATGKKIKNRAFVCILVSLKKFRLVMNTEPIASTAFTVFIDDGGSVDLLIKQFRHRHLSKHFINCHPTRTITINLIRLRAECQTKLEVKSLEIFLPECEVVYSEREGAIGHIATLSACFPFNVEGTEPNVTLRIQHLSQCFTVFQLWIATLGDTLASVKNLFARGTPADLALHNITRNPLVQRIKKEKERQRSSVTAAESNDDSRLLVTLYVTQGLCQVDMGSGNAHQLLFGCGRLALERFARVDNSTSYLLLCHISNVAVRSEGVLSGTAGITNTRIKGFFIHNARDALIFRRSDDKRTFRGVTQVDRVYVAFKERQLKDIVECKVGSLCWNAMDGVGEEDYSTTKLEVVLSKGTLGVTPSTVPAFLTFLRGISTIVADQKRIAMEKLKDRIHLRKTLSVFAEQMHRRSNHAAPAVTLESAKLQRQQSAPSIHSWRGSQVSSPFSSPDAPLELDANPLPRWSSPSASPLSNVNTTAAKQQDAAVLSGSTSGVFHMGSGFIPFMGTQLTRIPCGQLAISINSTTLLLGAISSGVASTGCVVASFPRFQLSYAECPCDGYTSIKKVLLLETENVELYRPGNTRVVIMGFKGVNTLDFFSQQALGTPDVGFSLTLTQTNPWTGNPRFKDFEEMILLVRSFTDKHNADVFQQFGKLDSDFFASSTGIPDSLKHARTSSAMLTLDFDSIRNRQETMLFSTSISERCGETPPYTEVMEEQAKEAAADPRVLRAIKPTKFSPQLRFGGDVSVNMEVILNWLGVTEKMLPNVINAQVCDPLEKIVAAVADLASEREKGDRRSSKEKT